MLSDSADISVRSYGGYATCRCHRKLLLVQLQRRLIEEHLSFFSKDNGQDFQDTKEEELLFSLMLFEPQCY